MSEVDIIPTVVPKHAGEFADAIELVRPFASAIHLDVGDGEFTNAISWPFTNKGEFVSNGLSFEFFPTEVHLMVERAMEIGVALAHAGALRVIAHIESFQDAAHAKEVLEAWREAGTETGISILATTPLSSLEAIASYCDVIQVMSVKEIGAQGATFDAGAVGRVAELRKLYPKALISVDGGVSIGNIAELARAGARRFSVGSAIMKAPDKKAAYQVLKAAAEATLQ